MKICELEKSLGSFRLEVPLFAPESGLVHGLIGPNGCGKTTLAKLMAGLLEPDAGRVELEGLSPGDVTMTGQKPYMMQGSVYENLVYPLKLRGIRPDGDEVSRLLRLCALEGMEKETARGLSTGQRQKLAIARALIFRPKIIILDESLSNLDPDGAEAFEREILDIQRRSPVTWFIISHHLSHISRLCGRVHFMDSGRVLLSDTPERLLSGPRPPELERFLALG